MRVLLSGRSVLLLLLTITNLGGLSLTLGQADTSGCLPSNAVQQPQTSLPEIFEIREPCWQGEAEFVRGDRPISFEEGYIHGVPVLRDAFKLSGEGVKVGVWDGGHVQDSHVEFDDRVRLEESAEPGSGINVSDHATHVAGTIGGRGQNFRAEGMAPRSVIYSYDWNNDISELRRAADLGVTVTNHSYSPSYGWKYLASGVLCKVDLLGNPNAEEKSNWVWFGRPNDQEDAFFGYYSEYSASFDDIVMSHPFLSIFVAAGNERDVDADPNTFNEVYPGYFDGRYCIRENGNLVLTDQPRLPDTYDIGGYDTLGALAVAKNVITVGAMADPPIQFTYGDIKSTTFSSWGPPDDGRIKPDIIAVGGDVFSAAPPERCWPSRCQLSEISIQERAGYVRHSGTSQATPIVSGTAALLNELAIDVRGQQLYADEMKAVLIHTALPSLPSFGPTYKTGWGSLQADFAGKLVGGSEGSLSRLKAHKNKDIVISGTWDEGRPMRVSLVWLDTPCKDSDCTGLVPPEAYNIDVRSKSLVNDLNLEVLNPSGEKVYYPWSLDPTLPNKEPTNDRANHVDNVERVDIPYSEHESGEWTIRISTAGQEEEVLAVALAIYGLNVGNIGGE